MLSLDLIEEEMFNSFTDFLADTLRNDYLTSVLNSEYVNTLQESIVDSLYESSLDIEAYDVDFSYVSDEIKQQALSYVIDFDDDDQAENYAKYILEGKDREDYSTDFSTEIDDDLWDRVLYRLSSDVARQEFLDEYLGSGLDSTLQKLYAESRGSMSEFIKSWLSDIDLSDLSDNGRRKLLEYIEEYGPLAVGKNSIIFYR